MTEALFARDGATLTPRRVAKGGWGEMVSGHAVGGLLGWAVEREVDDADMQPARLTVDLPRPTALEPIDVRSRVLRDGKRLKLVEASLEQQGVEVARASALFLRRCEQPPGDVWTETVTMPPVPSEDEIAAASLFVRTYGWGVDVQRPDPMWTRTGTKYTWLNLSQPVVDGAPLTPFTRAAMAGDITASLANWGTSGLQYINADYTITLSRLPDGLATGTATLVDLRGAVGSCVAVAVAHSGFNPPTA
jgi:hypothetical protein